MELKAGQVVRGVILQMMDNNEAVVQINGVQVRAQLELPLQVGQAAMLQVQSQSSSSLIILKQMDPNAAGALPDDMVKDWMKQLGLPDQKWAAELVKNLRKEGFAFTREAAQAFQQAASSMPQGGDAEQWMQAAATAFKRGLPMTGATVSGLQQVMFGRPTHELLDRLQQQLAAVSGDAPEAEGSEAKPLPQLAAKLQALLAEGAALLRTAAEGGEPAAAARAAGGAASAAAPQAAVAAQAQLAVASDGEAPPAAAKAAATPAGAQAATSADAPESSAGASVRPAAGGTPNWLGQFMKWLGVDYENQLSKQFTAANAAVRTAPQAQQLQQQDMQANPDIAPETRVDGTSGRLPIQGEHRMGSQHAMPSHAQQASTTNGIGDFRQTLERVQQDSAAVIQQALDHSPILDDGKPAVQESLKSLLLSLTSSNDAPPALRETAQQLIQQITGQQLMLTPERNGAMFTHLTMHVPLNGPDGNQTASINIQTRRGRRGELDADNCRLLFNLSMKTLGETIVDVNVTDKIVSLTLWNNHPAIGTLADSARAEVAESLNQAGYQLSSLRATPIIKREESDPESQGTDQPKPKLPDPVQFSSTRYKGVDYRI